LNNEFRNKTLNQKFEYVTTAQGVIKKFEESLAETELQLKKIDQLSKEQRDEAEENYFEKTGKMISLEETKAELLEKCRVLKEHIDGFNHIISGIL